MKIATSEEVMNAIEDAFGLPKTTKRMVIDLQLGEAARVIRVELLTREQADALVESLKKCNADVT